MSSAERVRLFRAKHAAVKPARAVSEDVDRLNARVAELEAALRSRDADITKLRATTRTDGMGAATKPLTARVAELEADAPVA